MSSDEAAHTVAVVAMSTLTAVAIAGNLAVLVAIARSPSLRVQLTNFFVVNLCVVDLVAATVVMPVSLADVNARSSSTNATLSGVSGRSTSCTAGRVLSTFVVLASVLSIALANVERYVSIRHPMQHAAQLTVGRTLTAIVGVWVAALGVAATPVVARWDILDTGTRFCGDRRVSCTPTAAAAFAVVVVALLFVAPTLMMAVMCCSIYRVARQAGRQVAPGVDDGHRPAPRRLRNRSSSMVSAANCCVVRSSVSCPVLNNIRPQDDAAKSAAVGCERNLAAGNDTRGHSATSPLPAVRNAPEYVIRITSHEGGASTAAVIGDQGRRTASPTPTRVDEGQLTAGVTADRRWKAAATLLFVLLAFMPLWSPYFAYTLYLAVERNREVFDCGPVASADHVETAVAWIGFATFASNAFVYGWMNRAIRDAMRETVDAVAGRCSLTARGRARLSQVLGAGDAEDFFQFLERTSSFDRTQSITQSSAASVELTTVN